MKMKENRYEINNKYEMNPKNEYSNLKFSKVELMCLLSLLKK